MADTAFAKVEDAVAAVIGALAAEEAPLEGWTVLTEHPADEDVGPKTVIVFTVAAVPEQADELGQTIWRQTLEIAFVDGVQASGSISRANLEAMAAVHAALAADRTLGGLLQDLQEIDIAGTAPDGKAVEGASVQYRAEFYTGRADWLTILGQSGATF